VKVITRLLTRYWGYLALAVAVAGYFLHWRWAWRCHWLRWGTSCCRLRCGAAQRSGREAGIALHW